MFIIKWPEISHIGNVTSIKNIHAAILRLYLNPVNVTACYAMKCYEF